MAPPPTTASPKMKRKAPVKQKQVDHPWSYIVLWYEEMRQVKNGNGFGPSRIEFIDTNAYRDAWGVVIEPWELDTIIKLDLRWFRSLPKEKDRPGRQK